MDNSKSSKKLISAVVIAKDEADNIKRTLNSLTFCDEVIVIDDNSKDTTSEIAKKSGAKVFLRNLNGDVSGQMNFGMSKAKNEHVLFIDADEEVTEVLRKEILQNLEAVGNKSNYQMKRIDCIWGKWVLYGEVGAFRSTRLVHKNSGEWARAVHQSFRSDLPITELQNPILHYPHQTLSGFVSHINFWSTLHAIENLREGKRSNLLKIILWPIAHFMRNYIFRLGFMDGLHGFMYALIMAIHSFLAWSKQYMLEIGYKKI